MPTSPSKIHVSAEGKWNTPDFHAHAWTSGDNRAKKWTYWWVNIDAKGLTKAEFEVFQDGVVVVPRKSLSKSPKLFAMTGFVDEEPDEDGDPIGGAAKLDIGIYAVDFYLMISGVTHVLRGVRFEVGDRKAESGGWQITTPLPDERRG
jgi:hypothetical protein